MSDKKDAATPKLFGERDARTTPATFPDDASGPGVLGRGAYPNPQPPADTTEELDDGRVIQTSSAQPTGATVEMYTPSADVTEATEDGRTIQIASKGVPMPMAQARTLGLVKGSARHGPQETK